MFLFVCVVVLLACLVACGGTLEQRGVTVSAPSGETRTFELQDDVHILVWTNADLHTDAGGAVVARAYDYEVGEREERHGQLYVARLLEVRGAWFKVTTGPIAWLSDFRSLHCIGNGIVDTAVGLELWVHEDDVAPVLTESWSASYPDGTAVELQAGIPIVANTPWLHGFLLPIHPPEDRVARWYVPAVLPEAVADEGGAVEGRAADGRAADGRAEDGGRVVRIDPAAVTLGQTPVPWQQPDSYYSEQPYARLDAAGDRVRVDTLGCGRAVFGFSGAAEEEPGFITGRAGDGATARAREFVAGTTLLWPDGTFAGTTTETLILPWQEDAEPRCFAVPVGHDQRSSGFRAASLEVCVAPEDVRLVEVPRYQVRDWGLTRPANAAP